MTDHVTTSGLRDDDRFAIVVSRYHAELTDELLRGAREKLAEAGVADDRTDVFPVPGAWEIPLAVQRLARSGKHVAIIALGLVIRGGTTHDRHINRFVSLAIGGLSLRYDVPVAFGVLTCNTIKQAIRRANPQGRNKGGEAAAAAIEMLRTLRSMEQNSG